MTDQAHRWPEYAERANKHFSAALLRMGREGVPVREATLLGVLFFSGAASTSFDPDISLQEILTLKQVMSDAFDELAIAAIARGNNG